MHRMHQDFGNQQIGQAISGGGLLHEELSAAMRRDTSALECFEGNQRMLQAVHYFDGRRSGEWSPRELDEPERGAGSEAMEHLRRVAANLGAEQFGVEAFLGGLHAPTSDELGWDQVMSVAAR
ncbi:MAG: hypothetical protein EP330_15930 [Deltaproteobacteria bacterium]|nr:MAG: hypothetical protein EP330_15930 [Deltaproteobacteria bacterium]